MTSISHIAWDKTQDMDPKITAEDNERHSVPEQQGRESWSLISNESLAQRENSIAQ